MRFLDFLHIRRRKIKSEFWGTMTLVRFNKRLNESYFECSRYFTPTDNNIEIRINVDQSGVTEKSISFFKQIEEQYLEICKSATPFIEWLFKEMKEDITIVDFQKEFQATRLYLPKCESAPVVWEMTFAIVLEAEKRQFTILMEDFEAQDIGMD